MPNYALEGPKWTTRVVTWSFADPSDPNSAQFSGAIGAAYQAVVRAAVARWDDVMDRLNISRGNASMSLRALCDWGIIRRLHKRGERREYFESLTDVWEIFSIIAAERVTTMQVSIEPSAAK